MACLNILFAIIIYQAKKISRGGLQKVQCGNFMEIEIQIARLYLQRSTDECTPQLASNIR